MTRPFRPAVAGLWGCVGVLASLFAATHSAESDARTHRTPKALRAKSKLGMSECHLRFNNFTLFAVAEKAVQDFWLAARRSRD